MMHYLYLINTLFIASISQVICVSVDKSLDIPSISTLNIPPQRLKTASESHNAAQVAVEPASQKSLTPSRGKQKDLKLQELFDRPVNIKESKGKKRKSQYDPNLSNDVSRSQNQARIGPGEALTMGSQCRLNPSVEKQKDMGLDLPNHGKESEGKKRKFLFDLNLPYDISWTETGQDTPEHQEVMDSIPGSVPKQGAGIHFDDHSNGVSSNHPQHVVSAAYDEGQSSSRTLTWQNKEALNNTKKSGITQPTAARQALASSSGAHQNRQGVKPIPGRYTFKKSGESALFDDHRVRKIGERWHIVPSYPSISSELKKKGLNLAIQEGLHPKNTVLGPWFNILEIDMQAGFYRDTGIKEGSKDIYFAVIRANKYLAMQFLASLQAIHSTGPKETKKLMREGWNFIEHYFDSWRRVKWDVKVAQKLDTSKCLGTYTPLQILGHFLCLSRSSRLSLCISWSLCNDWYEGSSYKKKKKISFEDYITMSHQYLTKANVFPKLEVVPCSSPDLTQMKRPSRQEKRRENVSVEINHYKPTVVMMKKVGEKVLRELAENHKVSSRGFVDDYCNHMARKEVKWPDSWKGDMSSLRKRVKKELFPCFLGMIQLLHPFKNEEEELNPAVVKGFEFLKTLLKGWGENDMERACQMESFFAKKFQKDHEEFSISLLFHLMKSHPNVNTQIPPSVYWGLWQVWEKMEGFKFTTTPVVMKNHSEFIKAIKKAYVKQE